MGCYTRLRRKGGGALPELAQDIRKLVRHAYPSATIEVREQLSKDCFVDSLNEHDLEWSVLQGKPKSIEDALRLALEYEAFQKGRRGRQGDFRPFSVEDTAPSSDNSEKNFRAEHQNGGQGLSVKTSRGFEQHADTYNRNKRKQCGFCQRVGHVENECRQKKQLFNNGRCFYCESPSHTIKFCEKRKYDLRNMGSSWGQINGQITNATPRRHSGMGNGY